MRPVAALCGVGATGKQVAMCSPVPVDDRRQLRQGLDGDAFREWTATMRRTLSAAVAELVIWAGCVATGRTMDRAPI